MEDDKIKEAFGNETKDADKKETEDLTEEETVDENKTTEESKQEGTDTAGDETKQGKTYTQEEVNAMMAKARKKYESKKGADKKDEDSSEENQEDENTDEPETDLPTGITVDKLAQAELKAAMAIQGVDPKKVARAVRLIDVTDVIDDGEYSDSKASEAIEELLADWPELKVSETKEQNVFTLGADTQDDASNEENVGSRISRIFGNK